MYSNEGLENYITKINSALNNHIDNVYGVYFKGMYSHTYIYYDNSKKERIYICKNKGSNKAFNDLNNHLVIVLLEVIDDLS